MPCAQFKFFLCTSYLAEPPMFLHEEMAYLMGQREKCPTTGREHWQFCGAFNTKKTLRAAKLLLPHGCHIEPAKSEAVHAYCHKDETYIEGTRFKYGELPLRRNNKTDWDLIKKKAIEGDLDNIPSDIYIRYHFQLESIYKKHLKPITRDIEVILIWGPPGTGKTHKAIEMAPNAYMKLNTNKWWDGYQEQLDVIIDDFSGDIGYAHLKRWLDKYPCLLEIKGSTVPAKYTRVIITSNTEIEEWWPRAPQVHIDAIKRRINQTINLLVLNIN